jgi:peptidyl-prolyl cis-trans isomerase SurA
MGNMKRNLFSLVLISLSITCFAQTNDPVIMSVNGKDIRKSEFEYIYNKNNNENAIDKRSLDEYIILFKNFKLRVAEAEAQRIDTTAAFKKELNEYRAQLAKPYLSDLEMNENLLLQAYERTKEMAELSAIFIAFPQLGKGALNLTPADTLETYQKAIEIRNKALQKGADFEALVKEYSFDERTKQGDRPGYLGWHSGLNLIPVLEIPIYNTAAGKITMPVRTSQGYYLLKILNKKPAPGEVNAAHILLRSPQEMDDAAPDSTEIKIAEIYRKLAEGVSFDKLAEEYSEDRASATKGGDLSWFAYGQMVPEFNDTVFSMTQIGAISQPVKTRFGYHIIQLKGKRPSASFDDLRKQLENKIQQTGGFTALYQPGIDKLKAENHYSVNEKAYKTLAEAANNWALSDSLYIARFENDTETLLTLGNEKVTLADFAAYLKNNPRSYFNLSTEVLPEKFNQFAYQALIDREDKNLENKYPEFRNLVQEYHDGILLFEVSNNEVWDKASTDTVGLTNYFEANRSRYAWDEPHWKGYVVFTKDSKTKKQMQKETSKMAYDEAVQYLLEKYKDGDPSPLKVEKGLFTKGQNKAVDELIFKTGKAALPEKYGDFFLLGTLQEKLPDSYTDVRGLVITDYQDYLEQEWLKSLNEKYPVIIYEDVIKSVQ